MDVCNLLIIDDDPNIRNLLNELLAGRQDILLLSAGSGPEAVKFFASNRVDVVLTDIHMPGFTGLELMADMKKINFKPEILVMTANATPESVEISRKLGARSVILKPFDDLEVIEAEINGAVVAARAARGGGHAPGAASPGVAPPAVAHPVAPKPAVRGRCRGARRRGLRAPARFRRLERRADGERYPRARALPGLGATGPRADRSGSGPGRFPAPRAAARRTAACGAAATRRAAALGAPGPDAARTGRGAAPRERAGAARRAEARAAGRRRAAGARDPARAARPGGAPGPAARRSATSSRSRAPRSGRGSAACAPASGRSLRARAARSVRIAGPRAARCGRGAVRRGAA